MNESTGLKDYMNSITLFFNDLDEPLNIGKSEIKTLLHILSGVSDFRMKGKTIYGLENLLAICFYLAIKGEFHSFHYAATYVRIKECKFVELGLVEKGKTPSHDTFRRIFSHLDAAALRDAFICKINTFLEAIAVHDKGMKGKYRILSGDGKTFNGSGRKDGTRNLNVFNIYNASTSVCLSSVPLTSKESEIPQFQKMLPKYDLRKTIVTADALHCQRKTCEIIIAHRGHYVFKAKGNSFSFYDEVAAAFADKKAKIKSLTHNDCDYEFIKVKDIISDADWPGAETYVRMVSHKRDDQKEKGQDYHYFVSSLKDPLLIAEAADNRWQIENGLHLFKDKFLREDDCTFTNKNAVQCMAVINNIVYSFYKISTAMLGYQTMQETKIRFKDDPEALINLMLPMLKKKNVSALIKENLKGRKKPE